MIEVDWGKDIFARLSQHPQSQLLIRDVLVRQFETSGSYDNSFTFVAMLNKFDKLSEDQLQRIFYAAIRNDQILPARYVARNLEALFRKHAFHPNLDQALSLYEFHEGKEPSRRVKEWLAQFEIAEQ
jgi:hypothetical protein